MSNNNTEIKFKYIFSDDYNPKYVNGAYGGIGPRGEIVINFFMERAPMPKSQTYLIENGKQAKELSDKRMPEDLQESLVRFVQNGIILDHKNAKEIHKWLGEHIVNLEKRLLKK